MPSRIGWSGWRFHRRSRSLASRHSRLHGGAHQSPKDAREVARMEHHDAHAVEHPLVDALDGGSAHLVVGHVAPPHERVGRVEHLVGEPVLGLVERRGPDREVTDARDRVSQRPMDPLRVDRAHGLVAPLVNELVPDRDADRIHDFLGRDVACYGRTCAGRMPRVRNGAGARRTGRRGADRWRVHIARGADDRHFRGVVRLLGTVLAVGDSAWPTQRRAASGWSGSSCRSGASRPSGCSMPSGRYRASCLWSRTRPGPRTTRRRCPSGRGDASATDVVGVMEERVSTWRRTSVSSRPGGWLRVRGGHPRPAGRLGPRGGATRVAGGQGQARARGAGP